MFVWPIDDLEVRQRGGAPSIGGSFKYGSTATIRDRGRVRKERMSPRAFNFAVEDEESEVSALYGHDFNRPLGSKKAGTLKLRDSDDALNFVVQLPEPGDMTSWQVDALRAAEQGLIRGVSPGFRVPPSSAVRGAQELIPEPGNPGVSIRIIHEAILYELSLVSRPAYPDTVIDIRADELKGEIDLESLYRLL